MYELIKQQFASGQALVQHKIPMLINEETWPHFCREINPVGKSYYHEFNPYLTCNISDNKFFKYARTFTVRDGLVHFGAFLLKYAEDIADFNTHFIVHPDLAPFVPKEIREYFSSWHLSQKKKTSISTAKKVLIFGVINDNYIGSLSNLAASLKVLGEASPESEIELCLPVRNNPFVKSSKESTLCYEVMNIIKTIAPEKKIRLITSTDFQTRKNFRDTYLIDLAPDNFVISDNYVHYHVAAHGGTVGKMAESSPQDAFFNIALSPYHSLHLAPFPDVACRFSELINYTECTVEKNPVMDPLFHTLFRGNI